MLKKTIKNFFSVGLFCSLFLVTVLAYATPGATVLGVRDGQSELPQVDGIANIILQNRINSSIKNTTNDLKNSLKNKNEVTYSYEVLKNNLRFLSMFISAKDAQGQLLSVRSVNVDLQTGDMYNLASFFNTSKDFFDTLEKKLGWRPNDNTPFTLSEQGIVFLGEQGRQTVGYENIFSWLIIGKMDYYLDGYRVTIDADKKIVRANVGNLIILFLESNRSTGYSWQMKNHNYDSKLRYIGSSYLLSSAEIGSNGWELMIFGIEKPGEVNLEVEYKRQWEKQSIKNLVVTIISE